MTVLYFELWNPVAEASNFTLGVSFLMEAIQALRYGPPVWRRDRHKYTKAVLGPIEVRADLLGVDYVGS